MLLDILDDRISGFAERSAGYETKYCTIPILIRDLQIRSRPDERIRLKCADLRSIFIQSKTTLGRLGQFDRVFRSLRR